MDYTVILIKPRAKELGIDRLVEAYVSDENLTITTRQPVTFDEVSMRQFAPHVKDEHLPTLLAYLNEDETTAWLIEGDSALTKCLALRTQIREQFNTVQPYTYIHASDSPEAAAREKGVIFL